MVFPCAFEHQMREHVRSPDRGLACSWTGVVRPVSGAGGFPDIRAHHGFPDQRHPCGALTVLDMITRAARDRYGGVADAGTSHLIMSNCAAYEPPEVKAWLAEHSRLHVHVTATHACDQRRASHPLLGRTPSLDTGGPPTWDYGGPPRAEGGVDGPQVISGRARPHPALQGSSGLSKASTSV